MEKLLSPEELADYLRVPLSTIYKWRHQGSGPSGFRVGRHIRYRPSDVQSWEEQQKASGSGGRLEQPA